MSITNDERREVATRLRANAKAHPHMGLLLNFAFADKGLNPDEEMEYNVTSYHAALRLADLIDPDPDLTCELEPTASERTNAPVRVYECDCCGRSCDSVYAEDYVYCPYCGRLNTAREVEVEE